MPCNFGFSLPLVTELIALQSNYFALVQENQIGLLEMTVCNVWERQQSLDGCAWQSFRPVDHLKTRDKWIAGPINKWIAGPAYNTCHISLPCFFFPVCLCRIAIFEASLFLEHSDDDDLFRLKDPSPFRFMTFHGVFSSLLHLNHLGNSKCNFT